MDRFGPKRLMLAGIVMAGGALVGLGSISTLTGFYVFYLFNALGYVCGGPLPNQVLLSRWFDANRGKAMGFAYLGIGVGGALVPLLAYALTQAYGWQTALKLLGLLMIAVALPPALFIRERPPDAGPRGRGSQARRCGAGSSRARSPAAGLLSAAGGSMCSIGAVGGTMQNLKLYLSLDIGYAQGEVARVLSLVLVGQPRRTAADGVSRRSARAQAGHAPHLRDRRVLDPAALPGVAPRALYVFAAAFGIGLGGDYMIIPLMAADLFGLRALGRVMGIVLTADGVAEAVVPMTVATLRDHTGSYYPGFAVLIALAAIGALAVVALPRTREVRPNAIRR